MGEFRIFASLLAALSVATTAHAQTASPAPPASDEILVVAEPGEQTRIDRKVYTVKNNAQAQTETALDVLRRVPSVTVTFQDQIKLLGDGNVTVLVDGHPRSDAARSLKALSAASIAKIEVATNPSAAFSADATGGVINIITRQDAPAGLAGSATAKVGRWGSSETRLAPTISHGKWTASLNASLRNDRETNSATNQRTTDDLVSSYNQVTRSRNAIGFASGRFEATYRPRKSRRITVTAERSEFEVSGEDRTESLSRGSDAIPRSEISRATQHFVGNNLSLAYTWTGKREGESLSTSGGYQTSDYVFPATIIDTFDAGLRETTLTRSGAKQSGLFKLDYVHPMHRANTLSLGTQVNRSHSEEANGYIATGVLPSAAPPTTLAGTFTTIAGYATYQFPVGKWKVLPGLRIEDRSYDVASLGATGHREDLLWFPSLHLDRKLAKRLTLSLSYSRRVDWPSLTQLNPAVSYYDALNGYSGNPNLKPQTVNSFETGLTFTPGKQSITVKIFKRDTADSVAYSARLLPNGANVRSPINAGSLEQIGGEFAIQGPIWKGWRYSTSPSFLSRRSNILENGALRSFQQFTYNGNFQIEYQDKPDGRPGADHFVLDSSYSGPSRDYQRRISPYFEANLTWTHSFTKRLAAVVKVANLFESRNFSSRIDGANFSQTSRQIDIGRVASIALVSRLGAIR